MASAQAYAVDSAESFGAELKSETVAVLICMEYTKCTVLSLLFATQPKRPSGTHGHIL